MGNRPKARNFSADGVQRIQAGYEKRIQNQVEIINRFQKRIEELETVLREKAGAELIATVLIDRLFKYLDADHITIDRASLEKADPESIAVVERGVNGGEGILIRRHG